MTPSQLELSAHAPCSSTIVGLAPVAPAVTATCAACAVAPRAEGAWLLVMSNPAMARTAVTVIRRSLAGREARLRDIVVFLFLVSRVVSVSWSVALEALLAPGIAVVVVAPALPGARLVVDGEGHAGHPGQALPQVQVRHQQPCRAALGRRQLMPIPTEGQPGRHLDQVVQGQVGGVEIG